MTLEEPASDAEPIRVSVGGQVFVGLLAGLVLLFGILWNPLTQAANQAGHSFDRPPERVMEMHP